MGSSVSWKLRKTCASLEYDFLSRCLGGDMVDTWDSKSCAKEPGGLNSLQGIMLRMLTEIAIQSEILDQFAIVLAARVMNLLAF